MTVWYQCKTVDKYNVTTVGNADSPEKAQDDWVVASRTKSEEPPVPKKQK